MHFSVCLAIYKQSMQYTDTHISQTVFSTSYTKQKLVVSDSKKSSWLFQFEKNRKM